MILKISPNPHKGVSAGTAWTHKWANFLYRSGLTSLTRILNLHIRTNVVRRKNSSRSIDSEHVFWLKLNSAPPKKRFNKGGCWRKEVGRRQFRINFSRQRKNSRSSRMKTTTATQNPTSEGTRGSPTSRCRTSKLISTTEKAERLESQQTSWEFEQWSFSWEDGMSLWIAKPHVQHNAVNRTWK